MTENWGWWTVLEEQQKLIADTILHAPWPDEHMLPADDAPLPVLREELRRFGSYLVYLQAQQGAALGRALALKETYEHALTAAKQMAIPHLPKGASEGAKETYVLTESDFAEALRETKRWHIQFESNAATLKGLIAAYEKAWETVSRLITAAEIEAKTATGRAS